MRTQTSIILILILSLLSFPGWSESLNMDDLVKRNELYYKKFTNVPFTGEVSGIESGKFKNGIKDGEWLIYYKNGQLMWRSVYKDGKQDVLWEYFNEDGSLNKTETWKDGKLVE